MSASVMARTSRRTSRLCCPCHPGRPVVPAAAPENRKGERGSRIVKQLATTFRRWLSMRRSSRHLPLEALLRLQLHRLAPLLIVSALADGGGGVGARPCEPVFLPRRCRPSPESLIACWCDVWPLPSSFWIGIAPSRCLHHHKPGAWGQAGRQPWRGSTTWTAMLAVRGKSSGIGAAQGFYWA